MSDLSGGNSPRMVLSSGMEKYVAEGIEIGIQGFNFRPGVAESIRHAGWVSLTGNDQRASRREQADILGADEVQIEEIGRIESIGGGRSSEYHYIEASLFEDGSPFAVEEDLDYEDATGTQFPTSNGYVFFTGPKIPVTAVQKNLLRHVNPLELHSRETMESVGHQIGKSALRELSERECGSLLIAVVSSLPAANPDEFREAHGI